MSDYIDYLKELFESFGQVEFRRMFGGHGVFKHDLMFALIANDVLYFKTDANLAREYQALSLEPFKYNKKNKIVKLAYYQAPEQALEDPDELCVWAEKSYAVALKAYRNN